MLPPESAPLEVVARESGVSIDTLERWRREGLAGPARERSWTAAARLEAVILTAAMDESACSAWCREQVKLLTVLLLCQIEEPPQDTVMEIDDLVGHRCAGLDNDRCQRCVTALLLKFCEVMGCHLGALAGNLEQPVLVDQSFDSLWQADGS
jgi:hypothetical protein